MKIKNSLWGVLLIAFGSLLMLNNFYDLGIFTMQKLWPLFILFLGAAFEVEYYATKKNSGLLVPGGILTTIGLLFLFETFSGFKFAAYTWPTYPLAVAIGLFQLYLATDRQKGLLVPVFILGGVSLISFSIMFLNNFYPWVNSSVAFPAILILIGIYILVRNFTKR